MEKLSYFAQLNQLFQEWMEGLTKEEKNLFCKDGLMLKAYKTEKSIDTLWDESQRKVMFVLKDKNTPDGDDTRLWLVDGKNGEKTRNLCGGNIGRTGFMPNIARILFGILYWEQLEYKNFEEFMQKYEKKIIETFNTMPFAFVEAKKLAGYSSVKQQELQKAIDKDGDFLMREIEILNPNIIVCCDAEDTQFDYIAKRLEDQEMDKDRIITINYKYPRAPHFNCHLRYYPTLNKAVIKSYHPTRRGKGKADWVIYEKVISPFRQLLNNYQTKMK